MVTFAPAASRAAFALSTSSFLPFSIKVAGVPSTRSFASFKPRLELILRTSLITAIFCEPASSRMSVNSSCPESAAPPAAAPPAAATATGAAAVTSNSSSNALTNSESSTSDISLNCDIKSACESFAIFLFSFSYSAGVSEVSTTASVVST